MMKNNNKNKTKKMKILKKHKLIRKTKRISIIINLMKKNQKKLSLINQLFRNKIKKNTNNQRINLLLMIKFRNRNLP